MQITKECNALISGQHLTSRTEAVRDFLVSRIKTVSVIGLGSFALNKKENHAFFYEEGALRRHFVFNHNVLKLIKDRDILILCTFIFYCLDIVRSLFIFRRKFDLFIGVSQSSGLLGLILKSMGICERCIYYAIDYYAPYRQEDIKEYYKCFSRFEGLFNRLANWVDRLIITYADEVWDISTRIEEGRIKLGYQEEGKRSYKKKVAPLGYDREFFRYRPIDKIDRYSIVFVGVVTDRQGLELMLEAMPSLLDIMPKLNVKIVGTGPFLPAFKEMVRSRHMHSYFKFYGFVEDIGEMLDIIASCAVGVSVWDDKRDKIVQAYYGDPGKTKLYSTCGLPVVVSNFTEYSGVIAQHKAGVAVSYDSAELANALKEILADDKRYSECKANAVFVAKEYCSSEKIFSRVLEFA